MRKTLVAASLLASFFLVTISHAQQPAPRGTPLDDAHSFHPGNLYTIHHNVSLVILDGTAIDAQGHAVTDLKQSDFHIAEDGVPQDIHKFYGAGAFTPAPDVTVNSAADLARLAPHAPVNIILLDEFTTRFEDMAYARYSLKKWLEGQPAKLDTPTILMAVSLEHFEVLRDYTQSKDELLNALNKHFAANPWHLAQLTWSHDMYTNAHLALRRVAEATSTHEGPKTMIWIGRGFPSNRSSNTGVDVNNRSADSTTGHTLDELRDARVTLYTIDPAGIMVHPELAYPASAHNFNPFGGDPRFQAVAEATGGRNFYDRNDVDSEIGSSIRDGSSVYTLMYIPPNPDQDTKTMRHIAVTVDRPGVKFITRTGYFTDARQEQIGKDGSVGNRLSNEMVAAGDTNMQYDGVRFTVSASPTDVNKIHLHVDYRGLDYLVPRDETKPRHARLIVLATVFDKSGKEISRKGMGYDSLAPADAPRKGTIRQPADFNITLDSNPLAARARFVVRVEYTGHMGTLDLPLTPGASASSISTEAATPSTPAAPSAQPAG